MVTLLDLTLYLSTFSCDGVLNCECTQQCDGVLNCVRQEVGSEYIYCVFNGNCIYKCIRVAALFAAQLFHLCMATNIMSNLTCVQSDFKMISTLVCDGQIWLCSALPPIFIYHILLLVFTLPFSVIGFNIAACQRLLPITRSVHRYCDGVIRTYVRMYVRYAASSCWKS